MVINKLERRGFIYKITNLINNKIYIGQSSYKSLKRLINRYARNQRYVKKDTRPIIRAIRKYGLDNFKFEIIKECNSQEELNNEEVLFIAHFNSKNRDIGYNLTNGGKGTVGLKWSKESKEKLSKTVSDGRYKGEKNPFYGKTHSEIVKLKVIESNKRRAGGTHRSPSLEARKKMGLSQKKRFETETVWNKGKEYLQIKGKRNPNYVQIDESIFREYIRRRVNYHIICEKMGIGFSTFYRKLDEFNLRGEYYA